MGAPIPPINLEFTDTGPVVSGGPFAPQISMPINIPSAPAWPFSGGMFGGGNGSQSQQVLVLGAMAAVGFLLMKRKR